MNKLHKHIARSQAKLAVRVADRIRRYDGRTLTRSERLAYNRICRMHLVTPKQAVSVLMGYRPSKQAKFFREMLDLESSCYVGTCRSVLTISRWMSFRTKINLAHYVARGKVGDIAFCHAFSDSYRQCLEPIQPSEFVSSY